MDRGIENEALASKNHFSWYHSPQYLLSSGENNFGFIPVDFPALRQKGLRVAPSIVGDFSQVKISSEIAFSALEEGKRIDGYGLESFIEGEFCCTSYQENTQLSTKVPGVIFDNHNHALYYWCKYLLKSGISLVDSPKIPLVHIDMHSDLWKNENSLEISEESQSLSKKMKSEVYSEHYSEPCHSHGEGVAQKLTSSHFAETPMGVTQNILDYIADFTNISCTVANYIDPAIRAGIIGEVIRIEGEQDLLEKGNRVFDGLFFLNVDLDFFAEELDDVDFLLKKRVIQQYLKQKPFVTVATSPFFIPSERALEVFRKVFLEEK